MQYLDKQNYPNVELVPTNSTAEASKKASKESNSAAIASEAASKFTDFTLCIKVFRIVNRIIQDFLF